MNATGIDAAADRARRGPVLALLVASYLMIVVDISIVITGLPRIQAALGFSASGLSWVQNAYTLAFGGLLLLGARAGDILGRRRLFVLGLTIFTLSSLAIGLAPSASWLLVARAIQGAGSAILAPSTLALLALHFPEGPERTRALSLHAAAAGMGATLGLVLGGLFAGLVSWRAGFFINLPIGLLLIVGARRYLHETPRQAGRFDLGGVASSTLGMSLLVYGLVRAADHGWTEPMTLAALLTSLFMLAWFVRIERDSAQPVLPLRLFASRERSGAYATRLLFLGGMVGFWFFSTQLLQGVLGYSPWQAGSAFLPTTIPNFVSAMLVPRLVRRYGQAAVLAGGLSVAMLGLLWLGQATASSSYVTAVAWPMVLIGLGQGAVLAPLTVAAVAGVAPADAGAASGLVNVAHQLGGALGLAVLVVVFAAAGDSALTDKALLAQRIGVTMNISALMLGLGLLVARFCLAPAKGRETAVRRSAGA